MDDSVTIALGVFIGMSFFRAVDLVVYVINGRIQRKQMAQAASRLDAVPKEMSEKWKGKDS